MKTISSLVLILLLIPTIGIASPGHDHGAGGTHSAFESAGSTGPITISAEKIKNLGIETSPAKLEAIAPVTELLGRVVVDPRRTSMVGARFSGRVDKLYVLRGEQVQKGEELLRVTPIQVGGSAVVIKSPTDGYITELLVSRGQAFNSSDSLIEVSNLTHVLFQGDLFDEKISTDIATSAECVAVLSSLTGKQLPCTIQSIDAKLKGTPPVAHVYAEIDNSDRNIKPGMTGTLQLQTEAKKKRLLVPSVALLGQFDERFLFIREGSTFERTDVLAGSTYGDYTEILKGVHPGTEIVTRGHYQLQFAKGEEDADVHKHDEHGHDEHEHGADKQDQEHHDHEEHQHEDHDDHGHSH